MDFFRHFSSPPIDRATKVSDTYGMSMKNTKTASTTRNTNKGNTMSKNANSSYNSLQTRQRKFIDTLVGLYGAGDGSHNYTRTQVLAAAEKCGMSGAPVWVTNDAARRAGRGIYSIGEAAAVSDGTAVASAPVVKPQTRAAAVAVASNDAPMAAAALITEVQRFIPEVDPNYVPWGNFTTIRSIVKSKVFFPTWITGLSGNGKTTMVEQVCAKEGREFFRVNITEETDEDDLLGGFRLLNGDTVWQDGPVVEAMNRGAVLLLDELDLGSFKCMCLQPVLEGKGVFLKKIGRYVKPSKGFTIFATANTKGKGSDDGRFVGTRVQNEAMLERFKATIHQEYAPCNTEVQILTRELASLGLPESVYKPMAENLSRWSDSIRQAQKSGVDLDEIVTTRRLVAIAQGYMIFGDLKTAMNLSLSRFDEQTREQFLKFYDKIAAPVEDAKAANDAKDANKTDQSVPF
jgi:MoxR-like ATPase